MSYFAEYGRTTDWSEWQKWLSRAAWSSDAACIWRYLLLVGDVLVQGDATIIETGSSDMPNRDQYCNFQSTSVVSERYIRCRPRSAQMMKECTSIFLIPKGIIKNYRRVPKGTAAISSLNNFQHLHVIKKHSCSAGITANVSRKLVATFGRPYN